MILNIKTEIREKILSTIEKELWKFYFVNNLTRNHAENILSEIERTISENQKLQQIQSEETRQAARQLLDILAGNCNAYPIDPSDIEAVRKIANWDIPET